MINLSNILDWMSKEEADDMLLRLKKEMPVGSFIIWRQLNNVTNYKEYLAPQYIFYANFEQQEINLDRSLFYSQVCIGKKVYEGY